jgi:hypothetical protein
VIDSVYEGRFVERISPGAFRKSLDERGDKIKIMWNHGRSEILPDVLIAKPKQVIEDERGAYYEAELFDGLPQWLASLSPPEGERPRLLLVGHEPDLGLLACRLIGAPAGAIELRKAGLAVLRLAPTPLGRLEGSAQLQLLLSPRLLLN